MKALFSRQSQTRQSTNPASSSPLANFAVPPFPQPLPERKLSAHCTSKGVVIIPKSALHPRSNPGSQQPNTKDALADLHTNLGFRKGQQEKKATSVNGASPALVSGSVASSSSSSEIGVLIPWGKKASVESISLAASKALIDKEAVQADGDNELHCYGILGIMRLFNNSYLFLITSRKLAGNFFHPSRPVYCCDGVLAIPLLEEPARLIVQGHIAKQATNAADESFNTSASEEDSDMDDVATPAAIPKEPFFSELKGSATVRIPKSRPWLSRGNRAVSEGPRAVLEGSQATEVGCGGDELESEAVPAAADDGENAELVSSTSPSTEEIAEAAISGITEEASKLTPEERWHEASKAELEEKVVKETAKHFARGEFWFAYDFDLTTPLQRKHDTLKRASSQIAPAPPLSTTSGDKTRRHAPASSTSSTSSSTSGSRNHPEPVPFDEPLANLPLWRRVDKRFWHNEHLARDFVNAGLHAFILPLIQGYFQITTLPIEPSRKVTNVAKKGEEVESNKKTEEEVVEEEKDPIEAQLLIISRRSKERAGLRYQRRGINEQGQVANYVETEQILFVKHQGTAHLASFVQFRGSIPLYWSQSPFSLKPPPVLERSKEENLKACAKHFDQQIQRYGKVTCVNLAEQSGKEGHISEAYRLRVADLKRGDAIQYVDFDFHKECSGMKFENVQKLIEQMMPTLAEMSFFWRSCPSSSGPSAGTTIHSEQKGAFRVSCLDCLDRTNVVQSSFGRHMLNVQLDKLKIRPRANETDANSDKIVASGD